MVSCSNDLLLAPNFGKNPWRFKTCSVVASTSPFLFSFQIHPGLALGAGNHQRSGKIPTNDWIQAPFHRYPHPPVSFPTPCRSPGGGGGPSLGQPKIFRCGSLCCCVGGCVVGHYHLHPLHSWQDILLTFAEMELDSTTMFPPGTSVMFIRSTGEPVLAQVVGPDAPTTDDDSEF